MRPGGLVLAFLLSTAAALGTGSSPGGSLAALALLPWLAIAPAPVRGAPAEDGWRVALRAGGWALPPLGLALGLDLARGGAPGAVAWGSAAAWALLSSWTLAGALARENRRSFALYSAAWLVALPGSAALWVALSWAPRTSGEPLPLSALFAANPLLWCHGLGSGASSPAQAAPAGLCALLVLIGVSLARRSPRRGPA